MGKSSTLINLAFALFPLVLGGCFVAVAILGPISSGMVALAASVCGVVLLAVAKLPAFRAGRWVSFGPQGLSSRSRAAYFAGWGLIVVAILLGVGILPFIGA